MARPRHRLRSARVAGLAVAAASVAALAQIEEGGADMAAPPTAGSAARPLAEGRGSPLEVTPRPEAPNLADAPWLQPLIDATPDGGALTLVAARYAGPALVTRPMTIDGRGAAVIDGGGKGTVLTIEGDGVTLRGVRLTGSGGSHDRDDACLNVRGRRNTITDNALEDCLFGIDLKRSDDNVVTHNRIRSKPLPLGERGDALRLWYSMRNTIEYNTVTDARDVVVWYSDGNTFAHNEGRRSRYSIHFMFATHNVVADNHFSDNTVGIYVMYTEGVEIRNNVVSHATGATGMGIGFKEASDSVVEGNTIVYCAIGIASDLSPYQPGSTVRIANNRIAYNGVGVTFVGDKPGTVLESNVFEGNLSQISQSGGGGATYNTIWGNYWDDYEGFDRDGDGIGDTPYELYAYTDSLWMEVPMARFFKDSPLMEALDFLERLAPFTTPDLLVRDERPLFARPVRGAL